MKIKIFSKEIEIDEKNPGIKYYLENMCESIDEIETTFWYYMRRSLVDNNINDTKAAAELRKMNKEELKQTVMDNIFDCLEHYDFSREYSKYVREDHK